MNTKIAQQRHKIDNLALNPDIWGKHYWFFLHSVAESYPEYPNDITKRKYYDLIMNMPLFIPHEKIGNQFATLLDKYPVSPYLVCRDSFRRWMNFIHNKINFYLGKEEIPLEKGIEHYYAQYSSNPIEYQHVPFFKKHGVYVNTAIIVALIGTIYYLSTQD